MDKFKIIRRIGWKLDDEGFPNQLDFNTTKSSVATYHVFTNWVDSYTKNLNSPNTIVTLNTDEFDEKESEDRIVNKYVRRLKKEIKQNLEIQQ